MAKAKKDAPKAAGESGKAGGGVTKAASEAAKAKAAGSSKKVTSTASSAPKARKAAKPAGPAGVPMIDTSLAARAAVNMVVNRDMLAAANKPQAGGEKKESGSFKQLKESLLKPTVQGPGGLLSPQGQQKKNNTGFGGRNQVGHNQTFGADVNRTGVPRRTGGG